MRNLLLLEGSFAGNFNKMILKWLQLISYGINTLFAGGSIRTPLQHYDVNGGSHHHHNGMTPANPTLELHPPASQPPPSREEDTSGEFIRRAPTKGSIYYGVGYNPKRHRREVLINSSDLKTPENSRFVMKNGYPHMEMVGELRVFETPQDVEYFESANPPSTVCPSSSSTLFFTLLVTALTVLSILLISVFLLISSRIRSKKNNSIHFAQ
ncbi:unnamed protein product [Caenorhabditis angaria]|uniref:Uncharacterized protein n=1 Tax=Caenorhabditis angaria TaxID=860376 RepID=A0A9P1MZR1_9PELO|nr:unnamed protein product [Caenorhabditis angaria]